MEKNLGSGKNNIFKDNVASISSNHMKIQHYSSNS